MKSITVLSLVSVVALAACNPFSTATPTPSPVVTTETVPTTTNPMVTEEGAITVIPVTANDYTYDVKEIRVKQGDNVVISLTNTEGFHDLVIDELGVDSGEVGVGQTVEIVIPTNQPGTYEYYCSVEDHRAKGMWGTLIIE